MLRNTILLAKEMGKEVHLYTSKTEGFLSGIPDITYHPNYYIRSRFRILTLVTFFWSQLILTLRLLRYRDHSCIFFVNTILPFSASWMGKLLGKKVVVHVHEYEISPKLLNKFLFWTVRSFADQIIVVSEFLSKNPSLAPRTSKVIYNAVKKEIEDQAFAQVLHREDFRVLMLASLRPYKGIYEFLSLSRELPEIRFDLVLSDSQDEVQRWKVNLNIPKNLKIWSVQRDVTPFFKKASLVINLAHKDKWLETFGMTILEGMHFGLPAIVPTEGGVTELVKNGVNGFHVDYAEHSKLKSLLKKMESDSFFWRDLSQNALDRVRLFTNEVFSNEMRTVLR